MVRTPRRQPHATEQQTMSTDITSFDTVLLPSPCSRERMPVSNRPERPPYTWLLIPSIVGLLVVALLLGAMNAADRPAAIMALVNITATVIFCHRFVAVNPVVGLIPALFIIPLMVLTCFTTLYCCLFNPELAVRPGRTSFRLLDGNVRFQFATLLAIVSYSIPWLLLGPRERLPMTYAAFVEHARRMAKPVFFFFITFISLLVTLRLARIGPDTAVGYIVYGFFRYGNGLVLLPGACWHRLGRTTKTLIMGVLAVNFLFNTFTNSRYYAFMPIIYFGLGLLFLSQISTRRKLQSIAVLVVIFGFALVVGNAGRRLGLGLWYGGAEDLQRRVEVLTQKTDELVGQNWADGIFTRIFFTGGHQIVTLIPETVPYKPFDPVYYFGEVVTQGLLPRKLAGALVPPVYEEKSKLAAIGHRLTEFHSVERSFVGSAWEMGGPIMVVLVSGLTGLYSILIARILQALFGISGGLGVVAFAVVCDRTFVCITEGLPSVAHEMLYGVIIGSFLYGLIRLADTCNPLRARGPA